MQLYAIRSKRLITFIVVLISYFCIHKLTLKRVCDIPGERYVCDRYAQRQLMKTPDGRYIPKYKTNIKFRTFGELSKTCGYVDDKIVCPDVRHHGETVFRQSQLAMNRLLKIFDVICKKKNISYWITSGTLLGAVRHKGSIPWDVDTDVSMIDEDYEKLAKIASKELPDDIMFQDKTSDPEFGEHLLAEAKFRDLNSCYGNNIRTNFHFQDGLQVDIFIFRKEIRLKKNYLVFLRGPEKYRYSNIFPLRTISYDGFEMSCPNKLFTYLESLFGKSYMTPPDICLQCPVTEDGYIPVPWYSCKAIESLGKKETVEILNSFFISSNTVADIFYRTLV